MTRPDSYREQPCCGNCIFTTLLGSGICNDTPVYLCHFGDHEADYWCPPKHAKNGEDPKALKVKREEYIESHCVDVEDVCDDHCPEKVVANTEVNQKGV